MRRTILFLAVLFMTVPAMAVSNVDITCSADGNEVTVSYESDASLIRAFGLDITITTADANITKLVVVDANYRIYPGQIVIVGGEVTDYNDPYAPGDLDDANVTVEMGSLYTWDANYDPCLGGDPNAGYGMEPGLSGTLLRFYVDGDCNYAVTENQVVGGIVMEDPDEEPVVDDPLCIGSVEIEILCTVPDVVGDTSAVAQAAIIAAGLTVGNCTLDCRPIQVPGRIISTTPAAGVEVACLSAVDYVVSKLGDVSGDGKVNSSDIGVISGLIANYGSGKPKSVPSTNPNYDSCGDVNGDNKINSSDIGVISGWIANYGSGKPKSVSCTCP